MGTTIQQWEEAGASLVAALTKYLDLSLLLEENAVLEDNSGKDLAMRIDSALFSLQTVVDSHVSRVRSALARTRNRILSPIRRLPREVLLGIFMNAIFAAPDLSRPEPVEDSVARIYLTLHNIIGVCKEWRDIALTQGSFWTIIPILDFPSRTREGKMKQTDAALLRSIVRAKGPLHLVATQPCDSPHVNMLAALASQFRTANFSARSRSSLRRTLDMFLSRGPPKLLALSQLSIYQKQGSSYLCKLPKSKDYVFPHYSPEQHVFQKISQNLSVLRIRGAQFHWTRFAFTNQLTELHLQDVLFGHELGQLFQAISSASGLRLLKLISIISFYNGPPTYTTPERSEIYLPNLQALIVKDLYFNTLEHILCSIASRSHCLTLLLTENCRFADTVGINSEFVEVHWEKLYELLRKVEVKDLLLSRDLDDPWLPSLQLGELLKSTISSLETLWLHSWEFDTVCSSALAFHHLTNDSPSPGITDLHISYSKIHDRDTFINMVLSHANLRKMVFGGTIVRTKRDAPEPITLENGPVVFDPIFRLQDFQLVEHDFTPPEFEQDVWQFW